LSFFKVSPAAEELDKIARVASVYSKEVSGTRTFTADAEAKQKLASDRVREAAAAWAIEPYRQLEQKRLETNEFN